MLPFHRLGAHKWAELNLPFPLRQTEPPGPDAVERARAAFRAAGVTAL
ncbi:hypothetical protein [Rhizomonospora bruguierae]|nr:hypothetical protein [Micromonospora sp. NBRC 107566]